jgi:CDP-paratose 2-epimerase
LQPRKKTDLLKKSILITGGCGFAGSNIAIGLKQKYPSYSIFVFDNLKRRGSELNLARFGEADIVFVHGDIRNKEDFEQLSPVDLVIDAAAEPSVLVGTANSGRDYIINTNFNGTANTLEFALKYKADFLFLSTSRVYPINRLESIKYNEEETRFSIAEQQSFPGISKNGISESFPMDGYRSLYGATKYASELLVNEYNALFGLKTVINRCGVLTGPYQMGKLDQGVVVLWLARHFWKKELSYIGYGGQGKQCRDILHIKDLVNLLDYQVHNMDKLNGELFNIGGGNDVSVSLKELTLLCQKITGNKINISKVEENRKADIRLYITDYQKAKSMMNWAPRNSVEQILTDTYNWLKENEHSLKQILN